MELDDASRSENRPQVAWSIEDVLGDGRLDFDCPFLPPALAGDARVPGLTPDERLALNQISGYAYVNLFAFVEEHIIGAAVEQAQAELQGDPAALRALHRFGEEEVKHQQLFRRALALFQDGFGSECEVLGDAEAVTGVIMRKDPLAVRLLTLHLELMTEAHHTESVRDGVELDPLFASMLEHHWLEEAQHARIDALEVTTLARAYPPERIAEAFDDYLELIGAFDGLLAAQAKMDVGNLARATGRELADPSAVEAAQHAAYRITFLVSGMRNRQFVDYATKLSPEGAQKIADKAATLA